MDCWQVWGGAFTPKSPFEVPKKKSIYVKRAKDKNIAKLFIGFHEYEMDNASNFMRGSTPDSNPKRGNTKMRKKIDINLCKSANAKTAVS